MKVLKLNADYTPIAVISWWEGLLLVLHDRANLLVGYNQFVASPSQKFQIPAVIVLKKYVDGLGKLTPSRENIFSRDNYTCQYCGVQPKYGKSPDLDRLTIDHIVPRAGATRTKSVYLSWSDKIVPLNSWENLVTACKTCNSKKSDMPLHKTSFKLLNGFPRPLDRRQAAYIIINRHSIPPEWEGFI